MVSDGHKVASGFVLRGNPTATRGHLNGGDQMRLSEAVHGYLLSISAGNYSEATVSLYHHYLSLFVRYLQDPELGDVTAEQVARFASWLKRDYRPQRPNGDGQPLSVSGLSNTWSAVRSFYNWAESALAVKRPDRDWPRPRGAGREVQAFSPDEVKRLVDATQYTASVTAKGRAPFRMKRATALRDRALILLLLDTGLRVSELCRLRVRDADLEAGEVRVQPHGTGQKTKGRTVYLGRVARQALWRYLAERQDAASDEPLFVTQGGRPMNRLHVHHLLKRLGERAGIPSVHPHRCRHTFAVQYLRNGGDVFTLQRLLGHSTLEMVRAYVRLADADAATAHRRASPVDRWQL